MGNNRNKERNTELGYGRFELAESLNWVEPRRGRSSKLSADLTIKLVDAEESQRGKSRKNDLIYIYLRNGRGSDISQTGRIEFCILPDRILFREATPERGYKLAGNSSNPLFKHIKFVDYSGIFKHWQGDYSIEYDEIYGFHYIKKKEGLNGITQWGKGDKHGE